jgi:uncharacterized protein YmfQ (DUF2313 family)
LYGINEYGTASYATNTQISTEDIEKYKIDLNKYTPPYVYTKYEQEFQEVQTQYDTESLQLGLLNYKIQDLLNQAFIDTATWGLDLWEEEYGIETNTLLNYEERREIVKSKKRGCGTTTIAMIKNTAEAFSGGDVNVIEHNDQYYFTIHFIGIKGIPRNMQAFKDMLEVIKPAHLNYDFSYTYNTWGMLKERGLTWEQAKNMTWDELRTY